jgi:hypothetical protein
VTEASGYPDIRAAVHERIRASRPDDADRSIALDDECVSKMPPDAVLWHYLEAAGFYSPCGALAGMGDPWKLQDGLVQEIWRAITDPANEELLKVRYDQREHFNARARRCVERAWDEMMQRKTREEKT